MEIPPSPLANPWEAMTREWRVMFQCSRKPSNSRRPYREALMLLEMGPELQSILSPEESTLFQCFGIIFSERFMPWRACRPTLVV